MTWFRVRRIVLTVLMAIVLPMASANAVTLNLEGVADPGQRTNEGTPGVRTFGDFTLSVAGGHFVSSTYVHPVDNYANNGTDWFQYDSAGLLSLSNINGDSFNFLGFDASEWADRRSRESDIIVRGMLANGGTVEQTFTTDAAFGFQTFTVAMAESWTNLKFVTFQNLEADIGYDNIRVAATPLPGALSLFGTGLAFLGFVGWRRKRRAAPAAA